MGWHAMQTTDSIRADVPSKLADLRPVALRELPGMASVTLDKAVQRVLPGASPAQDGGAFFNSSV